MLLALRLGGNRPSRRRVRVVSWEGVPETEAGAQVREWLHGGGESGGASTYAGEKAQPLCGMRGGDGADAGPGSPSAWCCHIATQ